MTLSGAQDMGLAAGSFIGILVWQALPWMLLAAAVGLVVAIILTVFLMKRQLLCRHTFGWNLLAKLGYVLLLLALPIGASIFAGVYAVHNSINARLDSGLRPMVAAQMPPLRMYLAQEMKKAGSTNVTSIGELIQPFKQHFSYVPTSDGRWERYKRYWINDVMVEPSFTVLADTIENKLLEKLNKVAAKVAGNEDAARQVFSLGAAVLVKQDARDPADALRFDREITQVVMGNLFTQLSAAFSPLYMSIWLPMLGIALLMVLEIVLYRRFYWPGRPGLPAQAATGIHPPLAG